MTAKTEPVYKEDIEDQEEEILNVWKMAHGLYERLVFLNADPVLLKQITEMINDLASAHGKIQGIQSAWAFPKM